MIALGLVVLVTVLLSARQRQEGSLREARQQTTDILRTVKDGLFLLDQKLVIGAAYSGALETLFQRKDFAGLAFEELLKNIVSERTLATALKFVKILWAERTNEKSGEDNQSARRSGSPSGRRQRQVRHPLSAIRFSPGAGRRRNDPGAGVGIRCEREGGSGEGAAGLAKPGSGPGRHAAGHSAHRSRAAQLVPERLERGHENDQCRAARTDPGRRRVSQEAGYLVPPGALGQGRGGRLGAVLHRNPRACLRGRLEGAAGKAGPVGQRLSAAGHQIGRLADAFAIGQRPGVAIVAAAGRPARRRSHTITRRARSRRSRSSSRAASGSCRSTLQQLAERVARRK